MCGHVYGQFLCTNRCGLEQSFLSMQIPTHMYKCVCAFFFTNVYMQVTAAPSAALRAPELECQRTQVITLSAAEPATLSDGPLRYRLYQVVSRIKCTQQ